MFYLKVKKKTSNKTLSNTIEIQIIPI